MSGKSSRNELEGVYSYEFCVDCQTWQIFRNNRLNEQANYILICSCNKMLKHVRRDHFGNNVIIQPCDTIKSYNLHKFLLICLLIVFLFS
jgi:hypothetical protein